MASFPRTSRHIIPGCKTLFSTQSSWKPTRPSSTQQSRKPQRPSATQSSPNPPRSSATQSSRKPVKFSTIQDARSAMESASNPDKLLSVLERSSDLSRYRRHSPIFCRSIQRLAKMQRPDLVDRILLHHKRYSVGLPMFRYESFWVQLLSAYSEAGMVDEGMRAFRKMKQFYCVRTEKSLCAVFSLHINNGMCEKVEELFSTLLQETGVPVTQVSYNLVLKASCLANDLDSARALLARMWEGDEVTPDTGSYNILLSACSRNRDASGFDGVVREMEARGLDFNLSSYNHRIAMLCERNEFVRAREVLGEMGSRGVRPDACSYEAIINGLCSAQDFGSAMDLLGQMLAAGDVTPNSFTYYSLIKHMAEDGQLDRALSLFEETLKVKKWDPPTDVAKDLVSELVKASRMQEAREVVKKLRKRAKKKGTAVGFLSEIEAILPS